MSRFFLSVITTMMNDDEIYAYSRNLLLQIMAVLYVNGQRSVHVGAAMRLMGVDDETASKHDNDRIEIDENFGELVAEINSRGPLLLQVPKGAIIH